MSSRFWGPARQPWNIRPYISVHTAPYVIVLEIDSFFIRPDSTFLSIPSSLTVKVAAEAEGSFLSIPPFIVVKVAGTAGIEPTFRESKSRVLAVTLHPFNKKKKNKIGVGAELHRLMLVIRVKVVGVYRYTCDILPTLKYGASQLPY